MSAALSFVDERPIVKARAGMIELQFISGDTARSFLLTRGVAERLSRELRAQVVTIYAQGADVIPLTEKRRKAKQLGKRKEAA